MWLCTRCHRRASFGAGSSDSARRLASGALHLEHRFCTWGNARAKVRLSQRHCHSLVSWALVHCQVPATALSWFTMSAMMLSTRGCGLARPGDVPDGNNTLRTLRQKIMSRLRQFCAHAVFYRNTASKQYSTVPLNSWREASLGSPCL